MPTTFVTAAQAEKQVTSHQARLAHAHTFGEGRYLLDGLKLTMETSNKLKAGAGVMLIDGSYVTVDEAGQEWTVENGAQAMRRIDLAGYEYSVGEDGMESLAPKVLKGTPHATAPTMPTYAKGSLLDRPAKLFVPIAKIELDGISAKPPTCMLDTLPTIAGLRDSVSQLNKDTGWVNIWESDTTHCRARRIGRTVFVKCDVWNGTRPGSDWTDFTTLSKGFRPDSVTYCTGSSLSGNVAVNVRIETSGLISVICEGATIGYWTFSACFPAA